MPDTDTLDRVIGPLREARRPLHEGLALFMVAARAVGEAEPGVALSALEDVVTYLDERLLPILRAEEYTLFPALDGVIGAIGACNVMVAQHRSVAAMAADYRTVLDSARASGQPREFARYLVPLLHGLYALVRAHLESEDDAYLTLLDANLSESQVSVLVENLERISRHAGG